jgi:hypothetical protein
MLILYVKAVHSGISTAVEGHSGETAYTYVQ